VASVTLKLTRSQPDRVREATAAVLDEKRRTQPLDARSCGCIFKNPASRRAGELLDRAGLKGLRCGGVMISERHANFFVNGGGARRRDWERLIEEARSRVRSLYGLELELEVEMW
jgi:UDP-N-acetylmuramate dehydrogenase